MATKQFVQCDECGEFGQRIFIAFNEDMAWEWDRCDRHAQQIQDELQYFVGTTRGRRTSVREAKAARRRLSGIPAYKAAEGIDNIGAVRSWAKSIGLKVPVRGRLDGAVIDLWRAKEEKGENFLTTKTGKEQYHNVVATLAEMEQRREGDKKK